MNASCEDECDFSMGEYCRVCGEGLTWEQVPTLAILEQKIHALTKSLDLGRGLGELKDYKE